MKTIISFLALTIAIIFSQAQGTVNINNRSVSGGVDAPIFDVDGATKLSGNGSSVQLYAGISANDLYPVGAAVHFRTGAGAGYMVNVDTVRTIQGIPPGGAAYAQLRVWDSAFSNYESAMASGGKAGASPIIYLPSTGNPNPPNITAPADMVGLQAFSLGSFETLLKPINLSNRMPDVGLDAPISGPDGLLEGSAYKAQLYAFLNDRFYPMGFPKNFLTGTNAGYIDASTCCDNLMLTFADRPIVLVAAWRASDGATYEQAAINGLAGTTPPWRMVDTVPRGFFSDPVTLRSMPSFTLGATVIDPDEAVLIPQPMLVNGQAALIWGNTGSTQWEVQYKNSVSDASWTTLGTAQVTNHMAGIYIDTTATNATRIYQLKRINSP